MGNQQGSLLLVEPRLRRPGDFLAYVASEFSQCHGSIAVGVGLSPESFQEVIGEEAMAVLVVFQLLLQLLAVDQCECMFSTE